MCALVAEQRMTGNRAKIENYTGNLLNESLNCHETFVGLPLQLAAQSFALHEFRDKISIIRCR